MSSLSDRFWDWAIDHDWIAPVIGATCGFSAAAVFLSLYYFIYLGR